MNLRRNGIMGKLPVSTGIGKLMAWSAAYPPG